MKESFEPLNAPRMGKNETVKYWEIIADKLNANGWSWGMTTVIDAQVGKLFVLDAHRHESRSRLIVRSDELLTAFLELEQVTKKEPAATT